MQHKNWTSHKANDIQTSNGVRHQDELQSKKTVMRIEKVEPGSLLFILSSLVEPRKNSFWALLKVGTVYTLSLQESCQFFQFGFAISMYKQCNSLHG